MISQIYRDKTLFGHFLLDIPSQAWKFSKADISSQQTFCRSIEFIARRILAPLVAILATLTFLPIGFTAKVLHYSVRSCFFQKASLASLALTSPLTVTFKSPEQLQQAVAPISIEEVKHRSSSIPLTFQFDPDSPEANARALRNTGVGNLLKHPVYQSNLLTVHYPESPRVPHHLTIALNRRNVTGIADVSEEENQAIFACINKIAEIYKQVNITGFVIAQYDRCQQGHMNRYTVEIIPHLPGFNDIKNIADKVDCNRYVLFRHANLSPVVYPPAKVEANAHFWKQAFEKETAPLSSEDITIKLSYSRYESHEEEAQKIVRQHLIEILQDKGGRVEPTFSSTAIPCLLTCQATPKP